MNNNQKVEAALTAEPVEPIAIAVRIGLGRQEVTCALHSLRSQGRAEQVGKKWRAVASSGGELGELCSLFDNVIRARLSGEVAAA